MQKKITLHFVLQNGRGFHFTWIILFSFCTIILANVLNNIQNLIFFGINIFFQIINLIYLKNRNFKFLFQNQNKLYVPTLPHTLTKNWYEMKNSQRQIDIDPRGCLWWKRIHRVTHLVDVLKFTSIREHQVKHK